MIAICISFVIADVPADDISMQPAANKPNDPTAPSTLINSNTSATITWAAPFDGGSAITSYAVAIRQSDGSTFTTESENCSVSKTSCTVTISIL